MWVVLGVIGGVVLGVFGTALWYMWYWNKHNPF